MWMTEQEVELFTRRKRPSAQIKVLMNSGLRPGKDFLIVDGRPILTDVVLPSPEKRVRKL